MVDLYKEFGLEADATEEQIRAAVGAPTREEAEHCICGKLLSENDIECYSHMSSGY